MTSSVAKDWPGLGILGPHLGDITSSAKSWMLINLEVRLGDGVTCH